MASGDWLLARGEVETIRTPGYPLFLALFQVAFGRHALIAATVCQQLMVFLTAMLAAWICTWVGGGWLGGLWGLTLGMFCVSQNSVANYLISDTLFGLLLTLAVAMLMPWFERPAARTAIVIGLLLGLATLVRPIAQFAWIPILVAMAYRWSKHESTNNSPLPPSVGRHVPVVDRMGEGQGVGVNNSPLPPGEGQGVRAGTTPSDLELPRLLAHGACLLIAFAAVLAPWYLRNYYCCGKVFLSKTAGLTMWASLFKSNSPLDPAVPFADAPKTEAFLARLDGVNLQSHWAVLKALQKQNLTRLEANDRMQEVCLEAIRAHPWKFVETRLRRFAWFWITPNGTYRPRTPEFHINEDRPAETLTLENSPGGADYCGQAYWRWEGYYRDGRLNWLWYPNPWLYLSAASVTALGAIAMLRHRRQRPIAVAFGLLLAYFGVMTAIGAPPEYRYRMPLEPIMVACVASLAAPLRNDGLPNRGCWRPQLNDICRR